MIDYCNINNLAENRVSAIFYSRATRRSGTNIAAVTQQKNVSLSFAFEMKMFTP